MVTRGNIARPVKYKPKKEDEELEGERLNVKFSIEKNFSFLFFFWGGVEFLDNRFLVNRRDESHLPSVNFERSLSLFLDAGERAMV